MDLETSRRELMKSAHVAIALVPALGAVPDDWLAKDAVALDANDGPANAPDPAIANFRSAPSRAILP
jgi:hypothetical protein